MVSEIFYIFFSLDTPSQYGETAAVVGSLDINKVKSVPNLQILLLFKFGTCFFIKFLTNNLIYEIN